MTETINNLTIRKIIKPEQGNWQDEVITVIQPNNSGCQKMTDIFCIATLPGYMLYETGTKSPSPKLDFYFGSDNLLAAKNEEYGGRVPAKFFAMALANYYSVLRTWNQEKGLALENKINDMMKAAKNIAVIVAHGETYEDDRGKFWGIGGYTDHAYGADTIIDLLLENDYDMVVMYACNPDDLPLSVETTNNRRPTIVRFTVENSFYIPDNITDPVKIIPKIE